MTEETSGHVCPPSIARWLNNPIRKRFQNPEKILREYVNEGDTVVDLGCGGGYFSVGLAEMVGEKGRVISVDFQQEMLDLTREYAAKNGALDRITLHKCEQDDLELSDLKVDFAIAFYVVHEAPDRKRFLQQITALLKPEAAFMIMEPKQHVSRLLFNKIVKETEESGLKQLKSISRLLSRGMVFGVGRKLPTSPPEDC